MPDAPPVSPPDIPGTDQLYKVPLGTIPLAPLEGVTLNNTPSQLIDVIAVITAVGFKVNVNINEAPVPQAAVDGVIV